MEGPLELDAGSGPVGQFLGSLQVLGHGCDPQNPSSRGHQASLFIDRGSGMEDLDLLVQNVQLVRPHCQGTPTVDLGIANGRFVSIEPNQDPARAAKVVDGQNLMAFPGLVDAHQHVGIYQKFEDDALSEDVL